MELNGALENFDGAARITGVLQGNSPFIEDGGVIGTEGGRAFEGLGGALPLACLGSGVALAHQGIEIVGVGVGRRLESAEGGLRFFVGSGERGELEEIGGLAGVEGGGVLIGFTGELPILLERVDLREIYPGNEVVGEDAGGLLQVGDGFVVAAQVGQIPGGVDLANDVIGIELEGQEVVVECSINLAAIVIGGGETSLHGVRIWRLLDSTGVEREVVVKDGNAALDLDREENEDADESGGDSKAGGSDRKFPETKDSGGAEKNAETDGRNIQVALGEEVDAEGVEAECRSKSEKEKAEGERE